MEGREYGTPVNPPCGPRDETEMGVSFASDGRLGDETSILWWSVAGPCWSALRTACGLSCERSQGQDNLRGLVP